VALLSSVAVAIPVRVSVPFARGTPPWPDPQLGGPRESPCFSPLREGDTSVAITPRASTYTIDVFQSPSRGGHLRGRNGTLYKGMSGMFQSPSRGGHLRGVGRTRPSTAWRTCFSPLREGDTSVACSCHHVLRRRYCFSPLREGDTSVAPRQQVLTGFLEVSVPFARGTPPWRAPCVPEPTGIECFSPLREGDTSVASLFDLCAQEFVKFQSPSRGGHLRGGDTFW